MDHLHLTNTHVQEICIGKQAIDTVQEDLINQTSN